MDRPAAVSQSVERRGGISNPHARHGDWVVAWFGSPSLQPSEIPKSPDRGRCRGEERSLGGSVLGFAARSERGSRSSSGRDSMDVRLMEGLAGGTPSPLRAHHGRPPRSPRRAHHGPPPRSPRRDRPRTTAPIPAPGPTTDHRPDPRAGTDHGPPPHPRPAPTTDHRPIPAPHRPRTASAARN
jgi:hypothetical protein